MKPTLTVSGYRGIWGSTLTEDIAREYVRAFGLFVLTQKNKAKPSLFVGRDGRESGATLSKAVIGELLKNGFDVIDLGMMATPIIVFLVQKGEADGAVIITASHNPIEYNGLKFVTGSGSFTTASEVAEIETYRGKNTAPESRGTYTNDSTLVEKYFKTVLSSVDIESTRAKKFRVGLDPINSVGCTTTPGLLAELGATAFVINGEPTGRFAHEPEPLPKNLTGLQALVREKNCDVGFAQDPDGDRLVVVDETGTIPSEETMLALCMQAVLMKTPGTVVVNLSTSNMTEDIAHTFGARTVRSKVGEANVVEIMKKENAVAGGEGGGGIIWPKINTARDSYVGIALILELMATLGKPLSEIINELPKYSMIKEKMPFEGDLSALYQKLTALFSEAESNTEDGLRLNFPDRSWLHVRPSNTEPIVRFIAEAATGEEAAELIRKAKNA